MSAVLLDDVRAFVRRFVVATDAQLDGLTLWVCHTHALDAWEQSPILAITSAEKRCGKTRLLDVLELLVARPWRVVMPSEAVVFRKIDADHPCLLLDEVDAIFGANANGTMEGLRALLNAGNRPRTQVPRCVGPNQRLENFDVYCAKALAGIRDLPETIADRSLSIRLKRKAPSETAERFRRREAEPEGQLLRDRLADWIEPQQFELTEARPLLPDELDDRAQDAWEPLFALADLAAGEWPVRARAAALALSDAEAREDQSAGVRLLSDARSIFTDANQDRLPSAELVEALHELEEAPWGEWYGRPISTRGIAKLLAHFEIRPRTIRLHDAGTPKGYHREQFEDAWARYLPTENATPPQAAPLNEKPADSIRHTITAVAGANGADSTSTTRCGVVADRAPAKPEVRDMTTGGEWYPILLADAWQGEHITEDERDAAYSRHKLIERTRAAA